MDIQKLERMEEDNYLFLVRRERSWLFDLPRVYTPGTYENLTWTSGLEIPRFPVVALLLRVERGGEEIVHGSVTLLEYPTVARMIVMCSHLPETQRERYIECFLKRCAQAPSCSVLEVIEFMRMGGETNGYERRSG